MDWQPISSAPKDDVIIRGWWFEAPGLGKSWECDIEYHDGTDVFVTHWLPLPPPPKGDER